MSIYHVINIDVYNFYHRIEERERERERECEDIFKWGLVSIHHATFFLASKVA
jgi:hypothetical protein